eukprot:g43098.t1
MDCSASLGKARGGGICFLINTSWCSNVATPASCCSFDLEYLTVRCHPYYLLYEFTSAILTAVYTPPHVEVKNAPDEVYNATNSLETEYPEALFIIAGDFNKANLKNVLPKCHQHVSIPPEVQTSMPLLYNHEGCLPLLPHLHFGKSDHNTVSLLSAYKQKLKHEDPVQKAVQCWSEAMEGLLWDCLERLHAEEVNPHVPQLETTDKLEIHSLLKSRSEVYKSGNHDLYRKSSRMKEIVIDFREQSGWYAPVCINAEVEMVKTIKFLG